jgi:hypothetical protein
MRIAPAFLRALFALAISIYVSNASAESPAEHETSYAKTVRPLLVRRCFKCHSSAMQEGELRLDSLDAMRRGGASGPALVPGDLTSRMLVAITGTTDLKMPPEGPPLSPEEIATLQTWIAQGAKGSDDDLKFDHWAFRKPTASIPAMSANAEWNGSLIDQFIASSHEKNGIVPLPPAAPQIWLRRVTLDLTGIPPTPEEISAFTSDASASSRESVVDRLLASPRFGERWGRHWMDVWRYSDWDGYGNEIRESQPHIWRWRDWIIDSLNSDKPYDRMIAEMLAGDELAPNDPQTIRATGFIARNWYRYNRNVWLDWTVEHTGKAFQGLTWNCARCHDHMYDPMPQADYYRLRAVFEPHDVRIDRVPGQADTALDGVARVFDANLQTQTFVFRRGNELDADKEHPVTPAIPELFQGSALANQPIPLPASAAYPGLLPFIRDELRASAKRERDVAVTNLERAKAAVLAARQRLEAFTKQTPVVSQPIEPILVDDFSTARPDDWEKSPADAFTYGDGRLRVTSPTNGNAFAQPKKTIPSDFTAKLRWKTTGGAMWKSVGISWDNVGSTDANTVYASAFAGGPKVQVSYRRGGADNYPGEGTKPLPITVGSEHELRIDVAGSLVNVWLDGKYLTAYAYPGERAKVNTLQFWAFDAAAEFARVEISPLLDASRLAKPGDASPPTEVSAETLRMAIADAEATAELEAKTFDAAELAIGSLEARIAADDVAFATSPDPAQVSATATIAAAAERQQLLAKSQCDVLTSIHKLALTKRQSKPEDAAMVKQVTDMEAAVAKARDAETAATKAAGETSTLYSKLTPTYPATSSGRRTALAQFITSPDNPLTARVAVNHVWLRHFGQPLVESVFDFGKNGKAPSHPELLDTLAVELMASGWDLKQLHRAIVLSQTYGLASSDRDPNAMAKNESLDPQNRWLWRTNVRRMEAEIVRDSMLATTGTLSSAMHGPDLDPNIGFATLRRSIYFRTAKEKKMTFLSLFDSANPVECYRRGETVAPQQALALVNSEMALSQSRLLAGDLWRKAAEGAGDSQSIPSAFVDASFLKILGREPSGDERHACLEFLNEQQSRLASPTLAAFTGAKATIAPAQDPAARARENLVQVLFNHNDFVSIR